MVLPALQHQLSKEDRQVLARMYNLHDYTEDKSRPVGGSPQRRIEVEVWALAVNVGVGLGLAVSVDGKKAKAHAE